MLALVNEAMAVLREGVVADADLIDAGVIFGSGFAPFRGGPLRYARERGVADVVARLEALARAAWRAVPPGSGLVELRWSRRAVIPSGTFCSASLHEQRSEHRRTELSCARSRRSMDSRTKTCVRSRARPSCASCAQGRLLFKEGDTDKRTYYLVERHVELLAGGRIVGTIRGGTPDARHPLAPILPRRCSARVASEKIEYLSIDSDLLDVLITWDQTGTYEVGELQRRQRIGRTTG